MLIKKSLQIIGFLAVMIIWACLWKQDKSDKGSSHTVLISGTVSMLSPFQNHMESIPSKAQCSGPQFQLSHNYPTS